MIERIKNTGELFNMRILPHLATGVLLSILATALWAGEIKKIKDAKARTSYSLGYQMGQDLKRQGVTLDRRAVIRGLEDGQTEAEPLMSREEISAVLAELKRRILARGRADDTEAVFRDRMRVYREQTVPVIEKFRREVPFITPKSAAGPIESVYGEIVDGLRNLVGR